MRLRCLVTPVAFLMLVCAHLYAEEVPKLERIEWSGTMHHTPVSTIHPVLADYLGTWNT